MEDVTPPKVAARVASRYLPIKVYDHPNIYEHGMMSSHRKKSDQKYWDDHK
jgi:hypothetical protein